MMQSSDEDIWKRSNTYYHAGYHHFLCQQNVSFSVSLITLYQTTILDWPKLKAFADNKFNVAKIVIFLLDRFENIGGKGEDAGYQLFLIFLQVFQNAVSSSSGSIKVWIMWECFKSRDCMVKGQTFNSVYDPNLQK